MDDAGKTPIPPHHVNELSGFFAAHDRWLFGHACVRTQGDRDLAADLVQDTFSAYATWWIRQAITRAVAGRARVPRIPVHMAKAISEIAVVQRRLSRELGREPSPEELAAELGTGPD